MATYHHLSFTFGTCLVLLISATYRNPLLVIKTADELSRQHLPALSQHLDFDDCLEDDTLSWFHAKRSIAQGVITRQLTLFQAAAQFKHFDQRPACKYRPTTDHEDFFTPGEEHCREVIHWVERELCRDGCQSHDRIRVLEEELAAYLRERRVATPGSPAPAAIKGRVARISS
jgi:hypothetical protein